jgi:hypothetical protein
MVTKVQSRSAVHSRSPQTQEEQLKIGLVLECTPDGPDQQVCEHLLKTLLENVQVESVTLINKPNLITKCGDTVARLLEEGCQKVIIVWDLFPPWGGEACRHDDREAIFASLDEAGVDNENVHLVCIQEELEAWLLADHRAVSAAISRLIGRTVNVNRVKEFEKKPKTKLMSIFRQHTNRPYQAHKHALLIVKELTDFKRIGKCESFARFASKARGV